RIRARAARSGRPSPSPARAPGHSSRGSSRPWPCHFLPVAWCSPCCRQRLDAASFASSRAPDPSSGTRAVTLDPVSRCCRLLAVRPERPAAGRRQAEMLVRPCGRNATTGCPLDVSLPEQVRLEDVLDGLGVFADGGAQGLEADRPAAELFGDGPQE